MKTARPAAKKPAARRPVDPVVKAIRSAPVDDEAMHPDEEATLRRSRADVAAGRVRPYDEARPRKGGGPGK